MKTNSLRAWILAVRPYSLGNAVILVAAGSALAFVDGGFHAVPALLCLLFAVLMQCTANLINDLYDFLKGADRPDRLGPDRAFAKGYITLGAMRGGIALFTAASVLTGCGILAWAFMHGTLRYGGWELIAVGAACILSAYVYTMGRYSLAYTGLGDIAVVLFFGLIPVGFTYYVQTGTWSTEATLVAVACGLVIDTMLMVNNFRDREEDALSRKKTVVVRFGASFGSWAYFALGAVAVLLCAGLGLRGHLWTALLPLLYLAAHTATWRRMVRIDHGEELNGCLGETARNIWLFGILLTAGILLG